MDTGVEGIALLTIFVLSAFTGYEVISKVSTVLHTPLLSGANAITGVVLVGGIIVAGDSQSAVELAFALVAVTLATATLVGGFTVTDRMLHMFSKGRPAAAGAGNARQVGGPETKQSGKTTRSAKKSARPKSNSNASEQATAPALRSSAPTGSGQTTAEQATAGQSTSEQAPSQQRATKQAASAAASSGQPNEYTGEGGSGQDTADSRENNAGVEGEVEATNPASDGTARPDDEQGERRDD